MTRNDILDIIGRHTRAVLPGLESHVFQPDDALRDLGANSIDRSEIVMMTLETLALRVPLVDLARAQNIGELADVLVGKLALQVG